MDPFYNVPSPNITENLSYIRVPSYALQQLNMHHSSLNNDTALQITDDASNRDTTSISGLHLHLVQAFFYYLGRAELIFDEKLFYSQLYPINRHPSYLMNSIYALGKACCGNCNIHGYFEVLLTTRYK